MTFHGATGKETWYISGRSKASEKWENHRTLWLVAQFRGCNRKTEVELDTYPVREQKRTRYKFPDKATAAS